MNIFDNMGVRKLSGNFHSSPLKIHIAPEMCLVWKQQFMKTILFLLLLFLAVDSMGKKVLFSYLRKKKDIQNPSVKTFDLIQQNETILNLA